MPESHTHGKDGADTAVVRYLISDDGTAGSIHDKPDISFDTTDFDIRFISSKNTACFVAVIINKGFDTDGGSLTVVGDLLMGDADVIKVFQACEVFLKDNPRLMWRVRHRDMTCALCLENLREDAFLGREFKSMAKKSTVNSR